MFSFGFFCAVSLETRVSSWHKSLSWCARVLLDWRLVLFTDWLLCWPVSHMDSYKPLCLDVSPQTDAVVTEWEPPNTKCFLSDSSWPCPSCFWSAILGTSVRWVWDTTTWRGTQPTAPPSTWTSCGRWWASRPGSTMARSLKDLPPSSMLCALWVLASISVMD